MNLLIFFFAKIVASDSEVFFPWNFFPLFSKEQSLVLLSERHFAIFYIEVYLTRKVDFSIFFYPQIETTLSHIMVVFILASGR